MIAVDIARTLPLRVGLGTGEALDSWLFRLAHRNGLPFLWLAPTLGFGDRLRVWRNYALSWKLPPSLLRRVEAQTGLPHAALDAAVLDQFDALGWKPIPGSRFCPACLHESDGQWLIRWQLPYTFACLAHRCLLAVLCPHCQRVPRSGISERAGLAPPTHCTLGATRHSRGCNGDLLTRPAPALSGGDPRLSAQAWVNDRLDRTDPAAVTDLRDLDALATWFRHRIDPDELRHLGQDTVTAMITYRDGNHAIKLHHPTGALIAAALTCQAIDLITAEQADDRRHRLAPLLRDVHTQPRSTPARPDRGPMILSHRRLTGLSQPLQHKVLQCIDGQLPVTERLRYRTRTATPRAPQPDLPASDRARWIPQYLWPDWLIRFLPAHGAHATDVAIDIANALLIPGNPVRNLHATGELTAWRNNTSIFLSERAAHHPDTLTAICALADYLDTHGSPIDYRRRRTVFTDVTLTETQWRELTHQTGSHPGRAGRLRSARRYLYQLLTGADLDNRRHRLAFTTAAAKTGLQQFHRALNTPLRAALHRHGAQLLQTAGIDEPLTWSPPAHCVTGLTLPGREPHDIDLTALRQLLDVEHVTITTAARRLGVTAEHVRYAQQQLHRPPDPLAQPPSKTAARRRRERAAELLTRKFDDNATNRSEALRPSRSTIRTPRPRTAQTAARQPLIDPDWLREQAGTLRRTNSDIGAELGISHETVRRHRQRLGIPARATGSAGHTVSTRRHPHLPTDIRHAVEGKRHGWQRLRRFEQVSAHDSINTAATTLGLHHQNLFHQLNRLEADIGAALIDRTDNRYQPMKITARGAGLLDLLTEPDVRQLLDHYAPPKPGNAVANSRSSRK
ncbi:TniQ family protein [Micromonospora inyonensis]|uniref:Regulatory helix-turn-helix protein, lysR family n=1 Tax=Micromonospora inyonensis TaxID=47866 RepID=A0A1C6RKP5_9ACTN|nr:TniQ family protein [Micromonospora inyonensis]SCL17751.1 regulatory helix-turn-helix protein, lysR family [Micromonospora inyonensis]